MTMRTELWGITISCASFVLRWMPVGLASMVSPSIVCLDIGELLQDVRGQDWPDHIEDLVDGQLRGDGVHWVPLS